MNEENGLDAELEAIKAYTQATMKNVKTFEDEQRTAKEEGGKRLCWRGKWQQNDCNVEYQVGDWVKVKGEFYRCTCDHWSEGDVKPGSGQYWPGYWDCYGEEGPASQKEREAGEQSNTIKRLEFKNRDLVNEIGILWKRIEVEKGKSTGHNDSMFQANRAVAELREALDEKIATCNRQEKEIDAYKDSARDLGRKLDERGNRIDELKEEVDGSKYLIESYSHENKLYKDKAAWWKDEAEKLEPLYKRYRTTAHSLHGKLNEIAGEIKIARENIAIAHTAEEWQEHLPDGYVYIEESVPFTKEDWDKVAKMAKITPVISNEEPIDMVDVEGSIEAAVQHYIDELNDAEEAAEKEG